MNQNVLRFTLLHLLILSGSCQGMDFFRDIFETKAPAANITVVLPPSILPTQRQPSLIPNWNACFCLDGGYLTRNNNGFHFNDDYQTPLGMKKIRGFDYNDPKFDIILNYNFEYIKNSSERYDIKREQLIISMDFTENEVWELLSKNDLFWKPFIPTNLTPIPEEKLRNIHRDIHNQNKFCTAYWEHPKAGIVDFIDYGPPLLYLTSPLRKEPPPYP